MLGGGGVGWGLSWVLGLSKAYKNMEIMGLHQCFVRIRNNLNSKFVFLSKTFYSDFVWLKFRLFCFIHSFLFLIQNLLLIFKKKVNLYKNIY